MSNTTSLDRQLADLVWMVAAALRAGYSLKQVFEQLASETPEPAASACAQVMTDLNNGLSLNEALMNWQQSIQSIYLEELVTTILKQQKTGGNLPNMIEPIGDNIMGKVGTDEAFYPAMRRLAQSVGASLPQRAVGS